MPHKKLIFISQAMLVSALYLVLPARAQLSADALVNAAYDSKAVDRRIPLTAAVNRHQVTVAMFVNRNSPTFEVDSKVTALNVAKALIDADITVTGVLSQFKSQQFDDFKEVFVGGGDVTAYSAGRKSKQEILDSLELVSVPQSQSASQSETAPSQSAADSDGNAVASIDSRFDDQKSASTSSTTGGVRANRESHPARNSSARAGINSVPDHAARDKLFSHNAIAFWYPPNWTQRKVSPNYWATPDEREVAEFACAVQTGHPFISLAKFDRISLTERLTTESNVGNAFQLSVSEPQNIRIGYRGALPATQVVSTGRGGLLYFKRVYFVIGPQLYALTLRCKDLEAATLDRDFVRILSTVHSPIRKAK